MFRQPNLSQSKQPDAHYDYDGLSGAWLWLPWWVHIIVAILAWPFSWWILPILPFQNASISEFLFNYKIQIASAISILTVITAFLSYLKAYRIRNRKKFAKVTAKTKQVNNEAMQKNIEVSSAKPKVKRAVKSVKKTEEKIVSEVKPKKTTKKTSTSTQKTTQSSDAKVEKKPVAKKKRTTTKKKNDQQSQLDF